MYKVVIADDNALSLKGLEKNLHFELLHAQLVGSFLSGMDVMNYVQEHEDVDLIVSDIRMPNMTGLELARQVLELRPRTKIILISAYDDFEYAQEALRIGVIDYVQKPIEYGVLESSMKKALDRLEKERSMMRRLEEARPEMVRRFYQDLMHTPPILAKQTLATEAEYLNISVSGGAFIALAVAAEESDSRKMQSLMLRALDLEEELKRWFEKEYDCYVSIEREMLLVVLHDAQAGKGEFARDIAGRCTAFCEHCAELFPGVCIGVGAEVESLWDLPLSYDAALRAVNRRFLFPDQNVFVQVETHGESTVFLMQMADSQAEIAQLLLQRNREILGTMTPQLAAEIVGKLGGSSLVMPYLSVFLSGIISRIRQEGVDLQNVLRNVSAFSARNRHAVDVREVEEFLTVSFDSIMEAFRSSQRSYQQRLVEKVKAHIEENLGDNRLRLESIAAYVQVTPSHLSRIFKRVESLNINDYITNKRIDKACCLLKGTQTPISEISAQIGYSSPYYFSACFKKSKGMSPSEYRNAT